MLTPTILPCFFFLQNNEFLNSVVRCLQMMLRVDDYRQAFVHLDGLNTVVNLLAGRVNLQLQYQVRKHVSSSHSTNFLSH